MFASSVRKSQSGFTLVELLIVVAIIGVLATLGVPTFKRMVQKSKKAEAKVNLGALYTAEQAFTAEYSVFGNNLDKIGFAVDGVANMTYRLGFVNGCANSSAIAPAASTTQGTQLQTSFPGYYPASGGSWSSVTGYNGLAANCYAPGSGSYDVASDGSSYIATAQAVIAPGYSRDDGGASGINLDVWTMDNNRTLANVQDGVK